MPEEKDKPEEAEEAEEQSEEESKDEREALLASYSGRVKDTLDECGALDKAEEILDKMEEDFKKFLSGDWHPAYYKRITTRRHAALQALVRGTAYATQRMALLDALAILKKLFSILI